MTGSICVTARSPVGCLPRLKGNGMAYEARRSAGNRYGSDRRSMGKNRKGRSPVIGRRLSPKAREIFLEGLKRYQERGVKILLDGKEVELNELEVIFEEREDGSFYMGDYIFEDETDSELQETKENCGMCEALELRETQSPYRTGDTGKSGAHTKCLKEICFDRVYNW